MCCAFDRHCFIATGWATAMMTAGWDEAKIIAEREKLAVWLINSKGEIWKSSQVPK
jgi:thiamine biosynthesis lipoprotein ApbE